MLDTLYENWYEVRIILLGTQKQHYIAHNGNRLFCRHASRDQTKARKRENADGTVDKMKCNGSHSTATDRSFFQRISRVARNFGLWWSKVKESFCKRRDTRLKKKNVLGKNERSFNIPRNITTKKSIIYNVYIIEKEICLKCCNNSETVVNSIQEH